MDLLSRVYGSQIISDFRRAGFRLPPARWARPDVRMQDSIRKAIPRATRAKALGREARSRNTYRQKHGRIPSFDGERIE